MRKKSLINLEKEKQAKNKMNDKIKNQTNKNFCLVNFC